MDFSRGNGRHLADEKTARKVVCGDSLELDDFPIRPLSIGPLSYQAADFGDNIKIGEYIKRGRNSPGGIERNQCALMPLSSGWLASIPVQGRNIPTGSLVRQYDAELRCGERGNSPKGAFADARTNSRSERMIASLCHDVRNPNKDRDYRTMCIFLSQFLESRACAFRVLISPVMEPAIHR